MKIDVNKSVEPINYPAGNSSVHVHGDDISSDKLFKLEEAWKILIERVLLYELQWFQLNKTDVGIWHDIQ